MRRDPKRSDGKKTFSDLLGSALELFAAHGYHAVSVPMISKKAGVKPPTFYQYFNSKESIHERLIQEAFNLFVGSMSTINDENPRSLVETFIRAYAAFFSNHFQHFRILHEAVYLKRNLKRKLDQVLRTRVVEKLLPNIEEKEKRVATWFVTGPIRFACIFRSLVGERTIEETMVEDFVELITSGIDPDDHVLDSRVFNVDVKPLTVETSSTKARLLQAAERLFGKYGYRNTMVSDITKLANVAAGTFYVYFQSKESILEELVMSTNRNLRLTIASAIKGFADRRDAEIAGYNAFLKFFLNHPSMYSVVRQAEFFNSSISRMYYEKIFNSYLSPLNKAIEQNMIRPLRATNLAVALMGIGHFMGEDLVVYSKTSPSQINDYLFLLARYLFKGLGSERARTSNSVQ